MYKVHSFKVYFFFEVRDVLNKFYVKFSLFCTLLLLIALIIDTKRDTLNIPIIIKDNLRLKEGESRYKNEYLIYVSDFNKLIFPLNIVVNETENFKISYYEDKITTEMDELIYMTFSLLTNCSNYLPKGVKTYIPQSTKLSKYKLENKILTLYVSDEFNTYNKDNEDVMFKIIYSTFTNINKVDYVVIERNDDKEDIQEELQQYNHLNLFINTTDINNAKEYVAYFYTLIDNRYYLVKASIYEKNNELSREENVLRILTNTINMPLISFIETKEFNSIDKFDLLSYYQYYLTCFENHLVDKDESIDIRKINYYEILLK